MSATPAIGTPLANLQESEAEFKIQLCIICQKSKNCKLTSTEIGRKNIINAASIRKDVVEKRLRSLLIDGHFSYHVDNDCYKRYTLKKTLENLKRNEPFDSEQDYGNCTLIEQAPKRTR